MVTTATLGFPRIGQRRELKQALERLWAGRSDEDGLLQAAREIRRERWLAQRRLGIDIVPSNDFSLYDHVLDHACLLGALPPRGAEAGDGPLPLCDYFALARGAPGRPALEMTKWFDTNYHYLVPELSAGTRWRAEPAKPLAEWREAASLGVPTRPVLIGPVTFLRLGKRTDGGDPLELLPDLLPAYAAVLLALAEAGATEVQLDEPLLVGDLDARAREAYPLAYRQLAAAVPGLGLHLTTYFGSIAEHMPWLAALPVHGLHVDLVRAPEQLDSVLEHWPQDRQLSLGLIDGRNVWRADLSAALALAERALARRGGERLIVAPSCSLLHVPIDVELETELAPELRAWLAFAVQKCRELAVLACGLNRGRSAVQDELERAADALAARRASPLACRPAVRERLRRIGDAERRRSLPVHERLAAQRAALDLPPYPTTTIGSFPQTAAVRRMRAEHRAGRIGDEDYRNFLKRQIADCIRLQEDLGLDVLVHGEFERSDMVEYFGEQLAGFVVTAHGWVQSYGSRCVKPPIIVGDVERQRPMTVDWIRYAQSLTAKPVKGMLTGPVTMLQWSFVRDDLPRWEVADQIALALRDEIADLEAAGIRIIQVDEPAFREGLPLRRADQPAYLAWAVAAFRLATGAAGPATQIHTHMCYSEFNDIIDAIAALDADVISIETARSRMEILEAFERCRWPAEIGPGVYDVHSPTVPTVENMVALLERAGRVLQPNQLWVNPDCGLKTRDWPETAAALRNLVAAAHRLRAAS